jgi:hypothetical protein
VRLRQRLCVEVRLRQWLWLEVLPVELPSPMPAGSLVRLQQVLPEQVQRLQWLQRRMR